MNIHSSVGMNLTNAMRGSLAGHSVKLRRGNVESEAFMASSAPIGHELLEGAGISLSEHSRVLFWELSKVKVGGAGSSWGLPQRTDLVIDQSDNSVWKLVATGTGEEAWQWHGQDRTAVQVMARKDS